MEFQDRILTCVDCNAEFVWTAGEQLFFADKNFKNEPKRCKACKAKRATSACSRAPLPRTRTLIKCVSYRELRNCTVAKRRRDYFVDVGGECA